MDDAFTKLGENKNINRDDLHDYLATGGHDLDPKTAAYCAAFVGAALEHSGIKSAPSNLASDYLNWGQPASGGIQKGDVLVANRPGVVPGQQGDHVGFATGKTDANGRIEMISGNTQGGQVETAYVDPASVTARRYDPSAGAPPPVTTAGYIGQGAPAASAPAVASNAPVTTDTRADRNFNPGNIADAPWTRGQPGYTGTAGTDTGHGVATFATPQAGFDAMSTLALNKYNGGATTADQLIAGEHGWTPGNHEAAANVARNMGLGAHDDLSLTDPDKMENFRAALAQQEGAPKMLSYADQVQDARQDAADNVPAMAARPPVPPAQPYSLPGQTGMNEPGDLTRGMQQERDSRPT